MPTFHYKATEEQAVLFVKDKKALELDGVPSKTLKLLFKYKLGLQFSAFNWQRMFFPIKGREARGNKQVQRRPRSAVRVRSS